MDTSAESRDGGGAAEPRDGGGAAERLLTLLDAVATAARPPSLADLARDTGLPKPTAHRLLRLLEERGLVTRDLDGRGFTAGAALVALARRVLHRHLAGAPCRAALERLSHAVGETCNLVVLDGLAMRYLERVEAAWPLRLSFQVGQEVPVHCTATGKLILALQPPRERKRLLAALPLPALTPRTVTDPAALDEELARIRAQGYGTDDEEFVPAMVAVAVAVRNGPEPPVAAVSIHAPTTRCRLADLVGYLPLLRETAETISVLVEEGGAAAPPVPLPTR
ncbi:IclR family transcriptional regulator [Azospirillum sp. ST 5-10]|uniref:IclR family transcriptional regulator n=1 Tax=unclassified Azospirillum TaxID=2630922 RepID=UPI003F4A2054